MQRQGGFAEAEYRAKKKQTRCNEFLAESDISPRSRKAGNPHNPVPTLSEEGQSAVGRGPNVLIGVNANLDEMIAAAEGAELFSTTW